MIPSSAASQTSAAAQENLVFAAKGGGVTFAGRIFEYGGRFVLGILLARLMGAQELGLYGLAYAMVAILNGVSLLGLDTAVVRGIPIFRRRGDEASLRGLLLAGLGLPFAIGLVGGAGVFLFAVPLAERVYQEPALAPVLRMVSVAIPFSVLAFATIPATRGFKKMHYKVLAQDVTLTGLKIVLVLILAFTGLNAVKAIAAHTVAIFVSCSMLLYFLHRLFPLNRPFRSARFHLWETFRFSLPMYLSRLMEMFGNNLQTILLGVLNTAAAVGIFTVASRVSVVGNLFHSSIVETARPIVSDLYNRGARAELAHFYQNMTKWTFTFNLPIFFTICLFARPILSIFGQDFVGGSLALTILAAGNLVNAATGICGVVIVMTGHTWLNMVNSVLTLALTLVLNILLVPSMGVVGAAIAVGSTVGILNILRAAEVYILLQMFPYNWQFAKPLIAGVGAWGGAYLLTHWLFAEPTFGQAVLGGIVLVTLYGAGVFLLGLSADDRVILSRLSGRARRAFSPSPSGTD